MPRLSAEQKAERRLGIGSSDVAELLGISPYEGASPMRLFAEKAGLLPDEIDEETLEKEVGHALEGALVALYKKTSGREVVTAGPFVETVVHPVHAWRRANLDARIVDALAALEVKAVGIGMAADWDLDSDDGIPHYVRVQCAWQMHVADLDEVHVVSLVAGPSGFRVFYVKRDLELEVILEREASAFWELVQKRKAPPLDATSATKEYLERLYPSPAADVEVAAPDDVIEIGERRVRADRAEKRAAEAKEIANNEIREAMGKAGATVMYCPTWRATWRVSKNGQRPLLVKGLGDFAEPKVRKPRANTERPITIDDGEAF